MRNFTYIILVFITSAMFTACGINRPLKKPILFKLVSKENYSIDTLKYTFKDNDVFIVGFERGFNKDVINIFNLDTIVKDTISSSKNNGNAGVYTLNYNHQKYFKIIFNHGRKYKIPIDLLYTKVYISYRFGVLWCVYTNVYRLYF
jgi:hypothetical protein